MINEDKINEFRAKRKQKIADFAKEKNMSNIEAAMWIDMNAPATTNRAMLAAVGYEIEKVTVDNVEAVVDALNWIGVIVTWAEHQSMETVAERLNAVINEEVPECWGGADMQEYVDLAF